MDIREHVALHIMRMAKQRIQVADRLIGTWFDLTQFVWLG